MVSMRIRHLCMLIVAALVHVEPAESQTVGGRVIHGGNGSPLEGVYVYLIDEAGDMAVGGLTDDRGLFVLRAPAAGRYELHAELIGYQPVRAGLVVLASNVTERRDLSMSVRAIDLAAIVVEAEGRCRNGPPAAPATQELWEDVRTALRVTRWTQETAAVRFGLVRTRRTLDPVSMDVKFEETQTRGGYFTGSPYVAVSADLLQEQGFVTRTADGSLEYWAPDAAVLLSESFLANHCFRIASPQASDPDLVGLAFEVVSGRTVPEVEGVLWIDAGTSELQRLDFRYVNLPFGERTRWDQVGGRVEFERLANGMWIVRRWHIRMPVLETRRRMDGVSSARQLVLAELQELGGEVIDLDDAALARLAIAGATPADSVQTPPEGRPRYRVDIAGLRPGAESCWCG